MQAVTAQHALFCMARGGKLGHTWMCNGGWKRSQSVAGEAQGAAGDLRAGSSAGAPVLIPRRVRCRATFLVVKPHGY